MRFYRLGEIPTRGDDEVFKASATGPFIWFIVFTGLEIVLLLLGIRGRKLSAQLPPAFIFFAAAAFVGLFEWMVFGWFRDSLKPTCWLLRGNGSGVIIKYRSFRNWRFPPEDLQAVGFEYSQIAWVRTAKERVTSPDPATTRGKLSRVFIYLDFCLRDGDTSALEAHLQAEQRARPKGKMIATVVVDYPVAVLPGGIVRVRWNGTNPSARKAIEYLGRQVKLADAASTQDDLTDHRNLSPADADAKILKLARSGDKTGAVTLAREIHGSTLGEAVALVDKLLGGG
jgi:hypothetical protein